jgi:hypothetical protein
MLMKKMFNEGNRIYNFISSSGSGTGSTSQKVTVPTVPFLFHNAAYKEQDSLPAFRINLCWRIQQKYDKLTGNVNALSSMRTTHIKGNTRLIWLLMTCMVSSRPKIGDAAIF